MRFAGECKAVIPSETAKHAACVERKNQGIKNTQTLLTTLQSTVDDKRNNSDFVMELTECFLEANIPLHKISHPAIVKFIEKHTEYAAPSESTMRNKCLPALYDKCIDRLKTIAANKYIWISNDETTDCEQRYVANFVFGILGVDDERGRSYIFSSKVLEATNKSTIAAFCDESIKELGKGTMTCSLIALRLS